MKPKTRYRPTRTDKQIIRAVAEKVSRRPKSVFKLEPSLKANRSGQSNMNIALLTSDPNWADVDLFDYSTWATLCNEGIDLLDGKGLVDIYIQERQDGGDMLDQIQIVIEAGVLVRVENNGKTVWNAR